MKKQNYCVPFIALSNLSWGNMLWKLRKLLISKLIRIIILVLKDSKMWRCSLIPKTQLWISKLIQRVSYFKMILLILYICVFSIIDAGKPLSWTPKCSSFEKWPISQVFIFDTQNLRNYDYPDCFGTLLTPSLVLTVASCFEEFVNRTGLLSMENTISIVKVTISL